VDWQMIMNIAVGAALTSAGWFLRQLWEAMERLRRDIHSLEVDLPSIYARKDEIREILKELKDDHKEDMKELKAILEKIFLRLDDKADKP
jgi:predicted HAD superfamily phosphohydrolase